MGMIAFSFAKRKSLLTMAIVALVFTLTAPLSLGKEHAETPVAEEKPLDVESMDVEELESRLEEVDNRIKKCRSEQSKVSKELRDVARRMYENRKDDDIEEDSELKELREQVQEAEKRYKELLAEYNKKLMNRPEMEQMKSRKQDLIKDSGQLKKEYRALRRESAQLKSQLRRLKENEE